MRIPFRLVDVFTDRPLAGNQLCVVPEPVDALDERMQAHRARDRASRETTFVTGLGGDRYAMRIFTPEHELPFAGHPSLGTAFVMVSEGRVHSPATQVVAAGEFPLSVDVEARHRADAPAPATFRTDEVDRRQGWRGPSGCRRGPAPGPSGADRVDGVGHLISAGEIGEP